MNEQEARGKPQMEKGKSMEYEKGRNIGTLSRYTGKQ